MFMFMFVFAGLAKVIFATYSNVEQYLHPQNDASDTASDAQYEHGSVAPITRRRHSTTESNYIQWQSDDRIYYNRNEKEERRRQEEPKVVGTKIISASVGERKEDRVRLKEPVIYTLEHKSVNVSHCLPILGKLCKE